MSDTEKIVLCFHNKSILSSYSLLLEKINQVLDWEYELYLCRSGRNCIEYVVQNTSSCSTIIIDTRIPWEIYSNNPSDTDRNSINNVLRLLREVKLKNPLINVILISKSNKNLELGHKEVLREFASNYLKHMAFERKHINRYTRECLRSSEFTSLEEFPEVKYIHEFTQALIEMRNRYFSDIRQTSRVKSFDELKSILVPDDLYPVIIQAARNRNASTLPAILLVGPTGTGKTSIAKIIQSEDETRDNGPFVESNLLTIPPDLIGAELFGYRNTKKFSPARDKIGLFQMANGGILFIDEICSLSLELQDELIRVIKTRSILRLNTRMRIPVDVKIIAATSYDMSPKIATGEFRQELYDLLSEVEIKIPPLSERPADITRTIKFYCKKYGRDVTGDVVDYYLAHPPAENLREIKTVIEKLASSSSSKLFNITDLLKIINRQPVEEKATHREEDTASLKSLLENLEHIATLGANKNNYEYKKELFPFFKDLLDTIGEKQFSLNEHVHLDNIFKGFRKYLIYLYYLDNRDKLFSDSGLAKILGIHEVSIRKIMPKKTIYQLLARRE